MRELIDNLRETIANSEFMQMMKSYDHSLLVNQPRLWVIRLPYLVAYALIANLTMVLFVWILPLKLHHVQEFFTILWLVFISCLVVLYLWNRQFRMYSPEKAYENTSAITGLRDYFLYLACILIIILPTISTSVALYYRFDGMITSQELLADSSRIGTYHYDDAYPKDLVIKYAGNTNVEERDLDSYQIRSAVGQSISYLKNIKARDFEQLHYFSFMYILAIHFGLLMFAGKQISKRVFNRGLLYGVIAFIVYTVYAMFISIVEYSPTIIGRLLGNIDTEVYLWPGPMIVFIFFMAIMALSVFYRKEQSNFATMNIFLLPVGVFIYMAYLTAYLVDEFRLYEKWDFVDTFGFGMLVLSPLLYLWLIPLLKAMYMRNLALPEK